MVRSSYLIFLLLLFIAFSSCRVRRPVVVPYSSTPDVQAYINRYKDLAVNEMYRTGVPASITLAQGMVESDYGRSRLAVEGNNHFGIKCHGDWRGPTINHHDDRRNECFRKYSRVEDSFYDHSDFLRTGSRYSFLFDLSSSDYKAWARGLKKAGYATNPDYANMLIRKIEEHNLYVFDRKAPVKDISEMKVASVEYADESAVVNQSAGSKPVSTESAGAAKEAVETNRTAAPVINDNFMVPATVSRVQENNRIQYIIVKDGESPDMIEKEFQLLRWELRRYNELPENFTLTAGQMLYLQPKRDRAEAGKETHNVVEGETMYSISQKYGIKLKNLYELNRMAEGEEPVPGQIIWLRNGKPLN
ncbi:MAG: glucosaminidase domain-containing protein [Bacteroidales bacterium]|nr:glucosaminidase domain-containing protein [Bacteroidales bacterium]